MPKGNRKRKNVQRKPQNVVVVRPLTSADKLIVTLAYPIDVNLYSAASDRVSYRWRSNGPYDVDPALGSLSVPGFNEYSALYSYNRVIKVHLNVQAATMETSPCALYLVHSNTDPGITGIDWEQYASLSYNKTTLVAGFAGQPAKRMVTTLDPRRLVGDRIQRDSAQFVGTSTANPTDLTFLGIGARKVTGAVFTDGIQIVGTLFMTVEFFDRKLLTSTTTVVSRARKG